MKRVLIVSYYLPPSPAVASLRPYSLAKYLPEFGWESVVLTSELPDRTPMGFKVIETHYKDAFGLPKRLLGINTRQNIMAQIAQVKKKLHIRSEKSVLDRLLIAFGEIVAYPDPQKGWRSPAVKAGSQYLQVEPVDAIISTSCPTSHLVAAELKRKYGMPWVADYQDPWTQNHYYPYSRLRRRIERRLETRTMSKADALVTVSEPWGANLRDLHRGKAVHMITNGFDSVEVNDPPAAVTDKFTITYTGNIYPGKQSPKPLFMALGELIVEGAIDSSSVEVRFYGAEAGWIDRQAEHHGVKDIIRQYGILPRQDALGKQRESQVLLLLKWNDPTEPGIHTAKVYEYLAARRPVIAVGGYQDVISELLNETRAGTDALNKETVKSALIRYFAEFRDTGEVVYPGDEDKINRYSYRRLAGEFADVLEGICHLKTV